MKVKELIEGLKKFDGELGLVFPAHKNSSSFAEVYEGESPHTRGMVVVRGAPSWRS